MKNVVNKPFGITKYKTINYLEDPLISSYFLCKEKLAYYLSIKHADNKRDYHSQLIPTIKEFLLLAENVNVEVLNLCIFSHKEDDNPGTINIDSISSFEGIHPEGYKLLELISPLTLDSLKKSYRKAVMIHHPDRGGTHENMLIINDAYKVYQDYLCGKLSGVLGSLFQQGGEMSKLDPQNANDYIYFITIQLLDIYCDEWDVLNSYKTLIKLRELKFYGSKLVESNDDVYRFIRIYSIVNLAKRLVSANRNLESNNVIKFIKSLEKISNIDYSSYIDDAQSFICGNKNLRVIINHPRQADNALANGIISKDKYETLQKKFETKCKIEKDKEILLNEFIYSDGFIAKLPYDNGINKISSKSTNIPEVGWFEDKKVQNISTDQQAEYLLAFSSMSTLVLVRKYTYVRLASYILSINLENDNEMIRKISNECELLFHIYDTSQLKDNCTKELIEELCSDISDTIKYLDQNGKRKLNV